MTSFVADGERLELFDHPYNTTILNERGVELTLARRWLEHQHGDGLELGHVLGHYGIGGHRVVDLTEQDEGVENLDVFAIDGDYDWILSISTLEHIGWDSEPRDPALALKALEHLRSLLRPGGHLFVTVPLGWHPALDAAIKSGELDPEWDAVFMRERDTWIQRTRRTHRRYGLTTPWAEAVWIATW